MSGFGITQALEWQLYELEEFLALSGCQCPWLQIQMLTCLLGHGEN